LAFSEIHPDYYQIPQADRDALLAEERAHAEEEAALRAAEDEFGDNEESEADEAGLDGVEEIDTSEKDDVATIEDGQVDDGDDEGDDESDEDENEDADDSGEDDAEDAAPRGRRGRGRRQGGGRSRAKEMDDLKAKRQAL